MKLFPRKQAAKVKFAEFAEFKERLFRTTTPTTDPIASLINRLLIVSDIIETQN